MELRHIRYFLAVAEELNFTRAAARVGIGQPPLSAQIKDLEAEIGAPLFHRVPHGAELTQAGQVFLKEARAIIEQAERAKQLARRAAQGVTGLLRIGLTSSAAFNPAAPGLIRRFRRRYGEVALTIEEGNSIRLVERLQADQIDVAFVRPSSSFPEELRLRSFAREALAIALPSSHRLASRRTVPLAELANEPFVLFDKTVGLGFLAVVLEACRVAGFEPNISQEAAQIASIVNLVAAEFGIALVPKSVTDVRVRGVAYCDISDDPPFIDLALATRRDERSAAVRNFLTMAPKAIAG